jgi:hypothetical protein
MATYNEIIFDIAESLRGLKISDDTEISNSNIKYHLNNQRALWLRNEYNKPGRTIDPQLIQSIRCMEVITVDAAECCSVTLDCYVMRTREKIPSLLELHTGVAITRVGPVHITKPAFNFSPYQKAIFSLDNKFTKNGVFTFLLNGYIYILTNNPSYQTLENITVSGVFANPEDLRKYKCEGAPCFSDDDEYPMNNWMIPYIKEQVINQFKLSLSIPRDEVNDAKEDLQKQ